MTKFICISGHAQHGKDTSAAMFKEELENNGNSVLITHYADLLKFMCKEYFGWDGQKDDKGRTLLQYVGTDCIRKKNPDYWVDFVTQVISMFPNKWDYVIIPDARFPNELEGIKRAGFQMSHVRVVRDDFVSTLTKEQKNHASETALDSTIPDYTLHNTSIEGLRNNVNTICKDLAGGN